jgi:phosphatidate cytidylyltransferase
VAAAPDARERARTGFSGRVGADLPVRALAGLAMMAVALGATFAGAAWFVALWLAAAIAIHWEWQRMIDKERLALRVAIGVFALVVTALLMLEGRVAPALALLAVAAAAVGRCAGARLVDVVEASGGMLYAGAMLIALALLRLSLNQGLSAILWLFAIVWGTDIMAYFGGRLIGGPKLWPRVSPGKTWSGLVVGVVCGAVAGLPFALDAGSIAPLFELGLAGALVAQAGDLFESALKRRFGVKDSSRLIPGHGGVMDRLDGFAAASLFAAVVGVARHGLADPAAGLLRW